MAVVGGGPSLIRNWRNLLTWPGDIWICCGAFPFCRENGLKGVFFNADPQPAAADYCGGATEAIVSTCSDPALFDALKGARITGFDVSGGAGTGATLIPELAVRDMGYPSVSFFGCDSSFEAKTHAYGSHSYNRRMRVRSNGREFITSPSLLAQASILGRAIWAYPGILINESEGLLAAMVTAGGFDSVEDLQ